MSTGKKSKKRLIAIGVAIVLVAAAAVGIWLFIQYKNDSKTVEVIPVSQVADSYWGDQSSSSGMVISDYVQELYPSSDKIISEIFVAEGDQVHIGDPLLQYDKTKLELDLEAKEIALKQADLNIDTAQKQLKKLQNTKPVATARPTTKPTTRPTTRPTTKPTARPTATPTPVPPADVTLYSRLDLDSMPYEGSGTTDDPYVFLCTSDCVITPEFLRWLLGAGAETEPTPTPTPEPEDTSSEIVEDEDENETESSDIVDFPDEEAPPTPTPSPAPTPKPASALASPFAAIFEVRDGNSNYGQLISAFKLDGTKLSANIQNAESLSGYNTLESIAALFGATPTPSPTANPNNYNDMGYTSTELKRLIEEKKQEIQDLQLAKKQAQLDLDKARLQLNNTTVLSTVDGTVRSLIDQDAAAAENKPFLVVSGDSTYYVSGALSESMLGSVLVGDEVTVMDYMTGSSYSAQIVSISDYPLEQDSGLYYYGSGNPNSSSYEFTAVINGADNLQNGQYVDITLNVQSTGNTDALYIQNAYIREDAAGSYVMKTGIDNRLVKQYVQTGRSLYGYSLEIKTGLTLEDYIAFPYGPDVKEGVRAVLQGTEEGPFHGDNAPSLDIQVGASSTAPVSGSAAASGSGGVPEEDGEDDGNGEEALPADLPEDAAAIGSDENGTYFETESGGGVTLD